jgi:hypothetical protein
MDEPTRSADPIRALRRRVSEREAVSAFLGLTLPVRGYVAEHAKLYSGLVVVLASVVGPLRVLDSKRIEFQIAQWGVRERLSGPRTWKYAGRE